MAELGLSPAFFWVTVALVHLVVLFGFALVERRQPTATLAWFLALIFLPVLGVLLYLVFGIPRRMRRARHPEITRLVAAAFARCDTDPGCGLDRFPAELSPAVESMIRLGEASSSTKATAGNALQVLVDAEATYAAMAEAIDAAEHHLHILFYIIQPDSAGESLRARLVERARAGVEVRVLTDAVGSHRLPADFWQPLIEAGGAAATFSPLHLPWLLRHRDRFDFRNHRKILVADGTVGFTGGLNIGREYLGLNPALGPWRDTHLRIEGPAVLSLQRIFAEDWAVATGRILDHPGYYPEPHASSGSAIVQIVDSGPDRGWSPIQSLYVHALALARQRAWLTNPYFVPSSSLSEALCSAALRGVDVRLLLPERSDAPLVTLASRSYFPQLLEAGVHIHLYERGFIHAKTLVIDTWAGTVGSANLDIRSFHLNYEINAFVYDRAFSEELAEVFLRDLEHAHRVDPDLELKLGYLPRLAQSTARLLSPLL